MSSRPRATALAVDWTPTVVLAVAAGHELQYNDARLLDWLLAMALVALLVVRRRAPEPVLVATLALSVLGWRAGTLWVADLGVLVALHAVAASRPTRRTFVAAGLVEVAAVVAAFRFAPTGSVNDAIVLLTGLTMTALLLGTTQRAQAQYLAALEDRAEDLVRERNQRVELAATQERTRIAREIHDVVAHSVSVMIALSEGAAATRDDAEARGTMRQVAATGRQALTELRRVLSLLRDAGPQDRAPSPTIGSLAELVDTVRAAGLPVELAVDPGAEGLPDAMQATIFRIVQESLTNTLKHASRPVTSRVRVTVGRDEIGVTVSDSGTAGSPTDAGADAGGAGIRGMSERVAAFEGELRAGPDGSGWVVRCTLPRTSRSERDPSPSRR